MGVGKVRRKKGTTVFWETFPLFLVPSQGGAYLSEFLQAFLAERCGIMPVV